MTAEHALADQLPGSPPGEQAGDGRMFCYRHPKTETWLRCGRCDQPICTRCSVQGPVGSRCRQCGVVANDRLSSFTPRQLLLGIGASFVGGAIAGYVGSFIGFFSIIVGYFAGRFVADAVIRVIGYKRGPIMWTILFGGILVGSVVGFVLQVAPVLVTLAAQAEVPLAVMIQSLLPSALISAGAACFGAYQRLR